MNKSIRNLIFIMFLILLFIKGGNNLLFNKKVEKTTEVEITLEVTKGLYHFKQTKTLVLYPNE